MLLVLLILLILLMLLRLLILILLNVCKYEKNVQSGGNTAPAKHILFCVCGWCQFILSPCSGWPSQRVQNCAFQASDICARSKSRRDLDTYESVKVKGGSGSPTKPGHGIFGGLGVKSKLCPVCSLGNNLNCEKKSLTSTKSSGAKPR